MLLMRRPALGTLRVGKETRSAGSPSQATTTTKGRRKAAHRKLSHQITGGRASGSSGKETAKGCQKANSGELSMKGIKYERT